MIAMFPFREINITMFHSNVELIRIAFTMIAGFYYCRSRTENYATFGIVNVMPSYLQGHYASYRQKKEELRGVVCHIAMISLL
jgi:hypothetical protein